MNENGKNKREWVKNAAIVFLAVMLVLTFFSNTIMNYSLPEVATNYVQSGTITAKIRGTGVVESGDPYEVKVTESRKVSSVAVRVGDIVQKGDVLLYLEDSESDELKAAKDALEQAQNAYEMELLKAEITSSDIYSANKNVSAATYRQQITNAQKTLKDAKEAVKPLEEKLAQLNTEAAAIDRQLQYEGDQNSVVSSRIDPAKKAVENATKVQKNAAAVKTTAANELADARTEEAAKRAAYETAVSDGDASSTDAVTAKAEWDEAVKRAADKETAYNNAVNSLANADKALSDAQGYLASVTDANNQREASQAVANLNQQKAYYTLNIAAVQKELDAANAVVEEQTTVLTELIAKIGNVTNLETLLENISKAQETVDELTAKAIDATVTADISGTVTSINVTAGNTTSAAEPVAVLQPEGKGYTLSFSVTNDQAKRLSVGDKADLVNAWRYDDVDVTLASIKPDKTDPGQKKLLTFDVTGSVTAGQTLNLSVGQKSANYDLIVPNSAIREDSNGKFILIVESKPSPLSTRYIATRVDVEVLASDDTQSAITGGLYGYEYVITTSTKPVEAGKQVRLANN